MYSKGVNTMVKAIYSVRFDQLRSAAQEAFWVCFTFDESQSKVASKGYLSVGVGFRDKINHKNMHYQLGLKVMKGAMRKP